MDRLSQIATFVRVVEAGSLSAAARGLGLSVPAVSRQLGDLERRLGVALTLRTTRGVEVTEAGHRYYQHGLRVLAELEAAEASVDATRALEGLLIVSAPVTFGLARVAPHVTTLLEAHRGLRVDLRLEDRMSDLVEEGVDVAIRVGGAVPDTTSVVAHTLTSFRRVVVASPAYLSNAGTPSSPEALASHEALVHLGAFASPTGWELDDGEGTVTVPVSGPLRSNAIYALLDAAIAGKGVALLPDWLVADAIADRRLVRLLPGHASPEVVARALHRRESRGAARIRVLLDHLRAAYDDRPPRATAPRETATRPGRRSRAAAPG